LEVVDGRVKISGGFEMGVEVVRGVKDADRWAFARAVRRLEEAWDEAVG
jgi:hypothetical protein